jgi:hypothetical protein
MTKKIKHVSELPEWFNLKRYQAAKLLDMYFWHVQLVIRKFCLTIKDMSTNMEPIEIIRKNTFIIIFQHKAFQTWYTILNKIHIDHNYKNRNQSSISTLNLRTFYNIQKFISPDRKTYEPDLDDYIIDAILSTPKGEMPVIDLPEDYTKHHNNPKQEWLNEPVHRSLPSYLQSECITKIDLNFPDDVLIEHFKKWLSAIRSEHPQPKTKYFKQSDFNSWVLYGVLPYLDLKIWEREKNVRIPNRVIADAIYQPGVGGEETVRKTTAPLVEYLLSEEALNQLAGQITLQNPEQKQA